MKFGRSLSAFKWSFAVVAMGAFLVVPSLAAATDRTDLAVGLKTLPMLDDAPKKTVVMAIVYDPANPASRADAEQIQSIVNDDLQAPEGVKLTGLMMPLSDLHSLSSAKMAFITVGLAGHFDAIAAAASAAGVLTMSTDLDCVRADKCVLGIVSKPTVEIYYSRAAGEAAKITFDPAFTMLVKKV